MFNFFKKTPADLPDYWKAYEKLFLQKTPDQLDEVRFVVLDTETTGFDYENDRVLCIGAIELINKNIPIKNGFEIYIHQEVYDKETAKIHGILKKGVIPRLTELEALKQFLAYLGNSIIIAHHAIFDITMLNKALERNGLPKLKNRYLDTSTLYKKTIIKSNLLYKKESYSLDDLADNFSISKKDRHTAMGDSYITAILFLKIVQKLKAKKEITLKYLFK
ncbi:3'-5' exonuclease [Cellulophaga baltica]|uniref:3'-5' exonuclease n=1 Tax=Cellulophaga TaxID=104264 RepID=UPI001C0715B5|nr:MULTISPECIES: 3'-5' exonuclease [Cellulophaga]MBU2996826.1 3'-5' exonuclease [Cellulophaga baltica]MDO6768223.1 3'-5' exonuclease [Cellulophaga sp. 1_MG-2023]